MRTAEQAGYLVLQGHDLALLTERLLPEELDKDRDWAKHAVEIHR